MVEQGHLGIMVIDDHEYWLTLMRIKLGKLGHRPFVFQIADDALRFADQAHRQGQSIDLVFIDHNLQGQNVSPITFAERINGVYPGIPIYCVTEYDFTEKTQEDLRDRGLRGMLSKFDVWHDKVDLGSLII